MASIVRETAAMLDDLAKDGVVTIPDGAWWQVAGDAGADDAALVAACRRVAVTYNHHSGTCRLGDPAVAGTVVASDLHVLVTMALIFAHPSVLPVIPQLHLYHRSARPYLRSGSRESAVICEPDGRGGNIESCGGTAAGRPAPDAPANLEPDASNRLTDVGRAFGPTIAVKGVSLTVPLHGHLAII